MDRKEFIKTCGFACLGISTASLLLQSCSGTKMVSANIVGENLMIPIQEFEIIKKEGTSYYKYLVVRNAQIQYPVCLYRISDSEYSALLMKCTHQGNELNAYGEMLVCSAHGSEFDKRGTVIKGPSTLPLKTFPIQLQDQFITISLKAT